MTKTDFLELLKKHNIDANLVVFDDPTREGYCVRKNYFRWEVFFRERGKEYACIGFPSESDALQYLFDKLFDIYGTHTDKQLLTTSSLQTEDNFNICYSSRTIIPDHSSKGEQVCYLIQ